MASYHLALVLLLWTSVAHASWYTCPYIETRVAASKIDRQLALDVVLGTILISKGRFTRTSWPYVQEVEGLRTGATRTAVNVARLFIDETILLPAEVTLITSAVPGGGGCVVLTNRTDFGPARAPKPSVDGNSLTYDQQDTSRPVVNPVAFVTARWDAEWKERLAWVIDFFFPGWGVAIAEAQIAPRKQLIDTFDGTGNVTNQNGWAGEMDTDGSDLQQGSGVFTSTGASVASALRAANVRLPNCLQFTQTDSTGTNGTSLILYWEYAGGETAIPDGYRITFGEATGTDTVTASRLDDGGATTLGSAASIEQVDGDVAMGCRQGDGTIRRFVNGTEVGTAVVDTTYMAAASRVGLGASTNTLTGDNFYIYSLPYRRLR